MFAQLRLKQLFPLKQQTTVPEIETNIVADLEQPTSTSQDFQKTLEEVCRSSMFWAEIECEPSLLEDLKE
ncbi:MAG: hypothetical protein QNJ38_22760 [Prochloraceae cyanobacterium]|nr:hypothetical protein [Prochloraceae cyanobacterium]